MKQNFQSLKVWKGLFSGLIVAGIFSATFSAFATPPDSPYAPGEVLNPTCSPGDHNCTVTAPLTSSALTPYSTKAQTDLLYYPMFLNPSSYLTGVTTSSPLSGAGTVASPLVVDLSSKLDLHAKADTAGNADTVTNGVYTTGAGTVFLAPSGDGASLTNVLHSFIETDPLSLHLNQTSPQTFTAGDIAGSGLLKVTSGTLGLDTSAYVTGTPWTGMGYLTSLSGHNISELTNDVPYLTSSALAPYSTKAQADLLYKPIGYSPDFSAYSTTSQANGLYLGISSQASDSATLQGHNAAYFYQASNPSSFITLGSLSAGTGISYNASSGQITNSAPDQTVAISAGTNITSVTGTYPNFTVNAATQTTSLTGQLHLDQTSAQTFTGGTVTGTGLLKVNSGTLGLDTSAYLTSTLGGQLTWNYDGDQQLMGNTDASKFHVGSYATNSGTLASLINTAHSSSTDFSHFYLIHNVPTPSNGTYTTTDDQNSTSYIFSMSDNGYLDVFQAPAKGGSGAPVFSSTPTMSLNMTNGYLTAAKFITSGGSSSSFVKGDGSLDSSTYLTSASLSGYAQYSFGANNFSGTGTIGAGAITGTNLTDSNMTLGSVLFAGTGGIVSQDNSGLFYDSTNHRLGVGNTSPSNALDVGSNTTGQNERVYATIGSEMVAVPPLTTSVFSRGNWTLTSAWDSTNSSDTQLNKNADGVSLATLKTVAAVVGTTYKVVITVNGLTVASGATYTFGGVTGTALSSATTYTDYITASTTAGLVIAPILTGTRFTINSISIEALTDNTGDLTVEGNLKLKSPIQSANGINSITIAPNGNVGVGTTSPIEKLSVQGNINLPTSNGIWWNNSQGGTGISYDGLALRLAPSGGVVNLRLDSGHVTVGKDTAGSSVFSVSGNAAIGADYIGTTAPTNGAIILGNVGIGVASPAANLDIAGVQNFSALTPYAPTAGTPTSGGSCDAGTHSWKVSFVNSSGETTPGTASAVKTCVATTGQTVPLTAIPIGPSGTTARKIYRTVAGNTGNYLLDGTLSDNTTTIFSDTVADASLGVAAQTVNLAAVGTIQVAGTTAMTILTGGNVGIGNTAPSNALDVGSNTTGQNGRIYATLGSNLITSMSSGWTLGTGWQYSSGLTKTSGSGTAYPNPALSITAGATYKVVIVVASMSVSTATYTLGGMAGTPLTAAGTYTDYITTINANNLIITPVASGLLTTITSVTVQQLTNTTGNLTVEGNLKLESPIQGMNGTNAIAIAPNGNINLGPDGNDVVIGGMNSEISIRGGSGSLTHSGSVLSLSSSGDVSIKAGGFSSGNVKMYLSAAGDVGIGTSAPTANFQVAQGTAGPGTVSVAVGGTAWTGSGTQFTNTFKVGDTITSAGQTLTIATITSDTALTTNAVGAAISGQPYTLTGGDRFTVLGNGNVGIGTTSHGAKLESLGTTEQLRLSYDATHYSSFTVDSTGNLTLSPLYTYVTRLGFGSSGSNAMLLQNGTAGTINIRNVSNTADAGLAVGTLTASGNITQTGGVIQANQYNTYGTNSSFIFNVSAPGTATQIASFRNNSTEKAFIGINGGAYFGDFVGIGNTAPSNALDVGSNTTGQNGRIYATLGSNIATMVTGDWTLNTDAKGGWSFDANPYLNKTASNGTLTAVFNKTSPTAGVTYKVVIVCSAVNGTPTYTFGGVTGTTITATTITDYITASTTGKLTFSGAAADTATITSITINALTSTTGNLTVENNLKLGGSIQTISGNNALTLDPRGYVGIGTSAPTSMLSITGTGNGSNGTITLNSNAGGINFYNSAAVQGQDGYVQLKSNYGLKFFGTPTWTELMRFTNIGDLGLGTTTPGATLQVAQLTTGPGTVSVSGTTVTGNVGSGGAVGTQFTNTFKVGDTITVTTTSGSETKTITAIASNSSMTTAAFSGTASAGTNYTLTGGTRFSVFGNGNVGIGTITPSGILDVEQSGAVTANNYGLYVANVATSATNSVNKYGMYLSSTGTWDGASAVNYGLYINTTAGGTTNYDIYAASGAYLSTAGQWTSVSTKDAKTDFQPIDVGDILNKINGLPVEEWSYKVDPSGIRHIGPFAEDFYSTFGVGDNDKSLSSIDPAGVALAGIQALSKEIDDLKMKINTINGIVGDGTIEGVDINSPFVKQVQNILAFFGIKVDGGVVDVVRIKRMEMVDSATGNIYCTWIENGEWQKTEGDCDTVPPVISEPEPAPIPTPTPTSDSSPTPTPTPTDEIQRPATTPETDTTAPADEQPVNQ